MIQGCCIRSTPDRRLPTGSGSRPRRVIASEWDRLKGLKGIAAVVTLLLVSSDARAQGPRTPEVRLRLHDGSVVEGAVVSFQGPEVLGVRVGGSVRSVAASDVELAAAPGSGPSSLAGCPSEPCKEIRARLARCNQEAVVRAALRGDVSLLTAALDELQMWGDPEQFWGALYDGCLEVALDRDWDRDDAKDGRIVDALAFHLRVAHDMAPRDRASCAVLGVAGILNDLGHTRESTALLSDWPISWEEAQRDCDGVLLSLGVKAVLAASEGPSKSLEPRIESLMKAAGDQADQDFHRYFLPQAGTVYRYTLESGGSIQVSLGSCEEKADRLEYELLVERVPQNGAASRSIVRMARLPFAVCWRMGDRLVPLAFLPCRPRTIWAWRLGEYEFVRACAEMGGQLAQGTRIVAPVARFRQSSLRRSRDSRPIVVETLQTYGPGCLLCDIEVLGEEPREVYTLEPGR